MGSKLKTFNLRPIHCHFSNATQNCSNLVSVIKKFLAGFKKKCISKKLLENIKKKLPFFKIWAYPGLFSGLFIAELFTTSITTDG